MTHAPINRHERRQQQHVAKVEHSANRQKYNNRRKRGKK